MASSASSDDEEDESFLIFSKSTVVIEDDETTQPQIETENTRHQHPATRCPLIDDLFLRKDEQRLDDAAMAWTDDEEEVVGLCLQVLRGQHYDVVVTRVGPLSLSSLSTCCCAEVGAADSIRTALLQYIAEGCNEVERECRAMISLVVGVAYLELYCQANYTGPELTNASVASLTAVPILTFSSIEDATERAAKLHQLAIQHLESDGDYAFAICEIPHTLLIARSLLSTLADPLHALWGHGIELTSTGDIVRKITAMTPGHPGPSPTTMIAALRAIRELPSRDWRSARAAVVHLRLLQQQRHDKNPTLWTECKMLFEKTLERYITATIETDTAQPDQLHPQLWLEWGLCCHHFEFGNKGKLHFQQAQIAAGLRTTLTGAMGKRTKYQQTAHAQMYLEAHSSLLASAAVTTITTAAATTNIPKNAGVMTTNKAVVGTVLGCTRRVYEEPEVVAPRQGSVQGREGESSGDGRETATSSISNYGISTSSGSDGDGDSNSSSSSGWQHAEWELGKRMVAEIPGAKGEEAAVREVMLDSMDGGPDENILLEGGPRFSAEEDITSSSSSSSSSTGTNPVINRGTDLHPVDQAIILALCLDVENSNPTDGLTNEEMFPYIERVLRLAKNWMIHSTALLQRSWLEFEKRRTMDRAMLQIQALLDQHTTKLTLTQSTYKCIEESAPAQDRLTYLHCIVYPAQYELKRDLAFRYLRSCVYASALNLFQELQLWDEVVDCYQLLQKPHRAEMVVREQLRIKGETPYMLTALADLTNSDELYEQAWILSKKRYARAKRTLARRCFDRGQFLPCIGHLEDALAIQPLVPQSWFLKGIACMRLELFEGALEAFGRCVQQDTEIGEAWANIGAIHMRKRSFTHALHALKEASKHKCRDWRIQENLMMVTLTLGWWREVIFYMNALLDLRGDSKRPIHKPELRRLVYFVTLEAHKAMSNPPPSPTSLPLQPPLESQAPLSDSTNLPQQQHLAGDVASSNDANDSSNGISQQQRRALEGLEQLLSRITSALPSDADVWDIFADFHSALLTFGISDSSNSDLSFVQTLVPDQIRAVALRECRLKQFRCLVTVDQWEKEMARCEEVAECARLLTDAHRCQVLTETASNEISNTASSLTVPRTELYAIRSLLQSAARKMEILFATETPCVNLLALLSEVDLAWETKTPLAQKDNEEEDQ